MDSVIRGLVIYCFLFVLFRAAGKRALSEITTFDLVVLLIISETTQQAMIDSDHSITNALLLIITLLGADIFLSQLKLHFPALEALLDSTPLILIENGKVHQQRLRKSRVDLNDILSSARVAHGIERLDQIKFAVLEQGGQISVIPYREKMAL